SAAHGGETCMIAASAWGTQLLMAAMILAVESSRGGMAENPIRNVRGRTPGPLPSPQPTATTPSDRSMRVRALMPANLADRLSRAVMADTSGQCIHSVTRLLTPLRPRGKTPTPIAERSYPNHEFVGAMGSVRGGDVVPAAGGALRPVG